MITLRFCSHELVGFQLAATLVNRVDHLVVSAVYSKKNQAFAFLTGAIPSTKHFRTALIDAHKRGFDSHGLTVDEVCATEGLQRWLGLWIGLKRPVQM